MMKRDIKNIQRDLEDRRNNDIIYKKDKLLKMFKEDPDIMEILGQKEQRPLNKFEDSENPTDEELAERKEIIEYNSSIKHEQIIPYIKLNGLQHEVINFLLFDVYDYDVSHFNEAIKNQYIEVMCLVHEDDMDTEYGIVRTDLLDYIVRDLLCWTNVFGINCKLVSDRNDIIDKKYYARTLRFKILEANVVKGHMGMNNKYDRFK